MTSATRHKRLACAAIACAATVVLSSCGDDDDSKRSPGQSSAASSSTTTNRPGQGAVPHIASAGKVASQRVNGSTVISIESERSGEIWEVEVVTSDGTEHRLDVSADGAKVISGPTTDGDSAADKAKHLARIKAAKLDYATAIDILLKTIPGGEVTELNLDSEGGATVWEADVRDGSGLKHEVTIDAASGKIMANTTGD